LASSIKRPLLRALKAHPDLFALGVGTFLN